MVDTARERSSGRLGSPEGRCGGGYGAGLWRGTAGGVEASWAISVVGDGLGSDLAVHGTHGRRAPGGFGSLLGVVRAREGAGEVVGSGIGVARPVGRSPPQGGRAAWRQEPCSLIVDAQRRLGWREALWCKELKNKHLNPTI